MRAGCGRFGAITYRRDQRKQPAIAVLQEVETAWERRIDLDAVDDLFERRQLLALGPGQTDTADLGQLASQRRDHGARLRAGSAQFGEQELRLEAGLRELQR